MDVNELTNLSDELMRFEGSTTNLGMITSDMYSGEDVYMDDGNEDELEADDVIILHMDIREPLKQLQKLLEKKIGLNLKSYTFWLQDAQELEPHKNLVDQCVKGEGLVQINVQIQTIAQRINIVDVLKPTEAALAALGVEESEGTNQNNTAKLFDIVESESENDDKSGIINNEQYNQKPCLNWVLDNKFKKEQNKLSIPEDPILWDKSQVKYWFDWAVQQFNLEVVNYDEWSISGRELCDLSHEEFHKKIPNDPGNIFWTHIQLLKECKFVSIIHEPIETTTDLSENIIEEVEMVPQREHKIIRPKNVSSASSTPENSPVHNAALNTFSVTSSSNGQVQLWQFLLELLTDREHINIIQWVGGDGEFKLIDPECVARLWGEKKNKPAMNYEKLSRALRYYYDGDMISKVSGKRFAYKFDCDLKLLIGYSADELSALVNEAANANGHETDMAAKKSKEEMINNSQDEEMSAPSDED